MAHHEDGEKLGHEHAWKTLHSVSLVVTIPGQKRTKGVGVIEVIFESGRWKAKFTELVCCVVFLPMIISSNRDEDKKTKRTNLVYSLFRESIHTSISLFIYSEIRCVPMWFNPDPVWLIWK